MKSSIYTILRDTNTSTADFRRAAEQAATLLACETLQHIEEEAIAIETPVARTTGYKPKRSIVLVPILRSGLALLPSFLHFFEDARVGFVGCRRNETTAVAEEYYRNFPKINTDDTVIILDPMLATGGSSKDAISALIESGVPEKNIIAAYLVGAPEGKSFLETSFPGMTIVVGALDQKLNDKKYIVPGLGDFGDRYFGTSS